VGLVRTIGRRQLLRGVVALEARPTSRFSAQVAVGRTSGEDWPAQPGMVLAADRRCHGDLADEARELALMAGRRGTGAGAGSWPTRCGSWRWWLADEARELALVAGQRSTGAGAGGWPTKYASWRWWLADEARELALVAGRRGTGAGAGAIDVYASSQIVNGPSFTRLTCM
jgi:hypothetical protein